MNKVQPRTSETTIYSGLPSEFPRGPFPLPIVFLVKVSKVSKWKPLESKNGAIFFYKTYDHFFFF